jgi:hypothetical protein
MKQHVLRHHEAGHRVPTWLVELSKGRPSVEP